MSKSNLLKRSKDESILISNKENMMIKFNTYEILLFKNYIKKVVISLEITPLAVLYPPPPHKTICSVISRGGIIMPTAFAPLSIVSV